MFEIPAVDLTTSEAKNELVNALEQHGIVTLKGINGFDSIRNNYLYTAFNCMHQYPDNVQIKTLVDGTIRQTLSTNAESVPGLCPELDDAHRLYMKILQESMETMANLLEVKDSPTSFYQIIEHGQHLDHVHLYKHSRENLIANELSLEMHVDNGVLLLTSKPLFYDENGLQVDYPSTGLVLELTLNGERQKVIPKLKRDELVVMIGEGFNRWANFGYKFPPVVHGMKMPTNIDPSISRMFCGRMVLMRPDDVLLSTGATFKEYTTATTQHLIEPNENFAAIACPTGQTLLASDLSCTLSLWMPSNASLSSTTTEDCMRHCNSPHMRNQVSMCQDLKCLKTGEIPNGGTECWMLCVEHLPDCALTAQTCLPNQTLICSSMQSAFHWEIFLGIAIAIVAAIFITLWRRQKHTTNRSPTERSSLLA
ncbi:hypothetical protein THRCLA_09688 [Thraustotheca clavata]|uniref:Uncharacterized protein n=1 Tax=Thraustotheca clavata TaxID=74557 RepID=A0A1V9YV03_9STRA|nr:hypothetical protein THRCLA_09688 [Thraustotheca clavata]